MLSSNLYEKKGDFFPFFKIFNKVVQKLPKIVQPFMFFEGYMKGVLKSMSLTKKEKEFCRYFISSKNSRDAASKAGFVFPELAGIRLLEKKEIKDEISSLINEQERYVDAADGLRRIAFGSVSDAVKLAFSSGDMTDLDKLDLFSVSEIKIPKGGGMELKFYDRIKALEALATMGDNAKDNSAPFIEAIVKGSAAIKDAVRSEDDEL